MKLRKPKCNCCVVMMFRPKTSLRPLTYFNVQCTSNSMTILAKFSFSGLTPWWRCRSCCSGWTPWAGCWWTRPAPASTGEPSNEYFTDHLLNDDDISGLMLIGSSLFQGGGPRPGLVRHGGHQLLPTLPPPGQRHWPGRDEGRGAAGDALDDPSLHARAEIQSQRAHWHTQEVFTIVTEVTRRYWLQLEPIASDILTF